MRQASSIYTAGSVSTLDITRALCQLLGRFSDTLKTGREFSDSLVLYGVAASQNAFEEDLMKLAFITPDDQIISVIVDLRALSREYLDTLVTQVTEKIAEHKKQRASEGLIPNIVTQAVAEVLH